MKNHEYSPRVVFLINIQLKSQSRPLISLYTSVLPGMIGLPANISAKRHPALQRSIPVP
jgi:hypothetical protein